jgi:hypothetical protein
VPFLDLEEELEGLGYVSPEQGMTLAQMLAQDGGGRRLASYRVVGTDRRGERGWGERRRAQKRECERRRRAAETTSRRAYRRHPPGTPRHLKGDQEKRREANRRWQMKSRAVARTAREEAREMADEAFRDFLMDLEKHELTTAAKMMCVGRYVYDEKNNPDLRKLFDGQDIEEVAARVDFYVWLTNPVRAWSTGMIAELFNTTAGKVAKALRQRSKFAGNFLDGK